MACVACWVLYTIEEEDMERRKARKRGDGVGDFLSNIYRPDLDDVQRSARNEEWGLGVMVDPFSPLHVYFPLFPGPFALVLFLCTSLSTLPADGLTAGRRCSPLLA